MGSSRLRFEPTAKQRFFTRIFVPRRRLCHCAYGGNIIYCRSPRVTAIIDFFVWLQALGIDRYSMLGWCNGGCTALIAASRAADRVDKLVVWSCNAYVTGKDLESYETTRDVHSWPEQWRLPQFEMYGERYVSDKWSEWIDASRTILDEGGGDVCIGALAQIDVPTLILHGAQDVLVAVEHAVYLHQNIKSST